MTSKKSAKRSKKATYAANKGAALYFIADKPEDGDDSSEMSGQVYKSLPAAQEAATNRMKQKFARDVVIFEVVQEVQRHYKVVNRAAMK